MYVCRLRLPRAVCGKPGPLSFAVSLSQQSSSLPLVLTFSFGRQVADHARAVRFNRGDLKAGANGSSAILHDVKPHPGFLIALLINPDPVVCHAKLNLFARTPHAHL